MESIINMKEIVALLKKHQITTIPENLETILTTQNYTKTTSLFELFGAELTKTLYGSKLIGTDFFPTTNDGRIDYSTSQGIIITPGTKYTFNDLGGLHSGRNLARKLYDCMRKGNPGAIEFIKNFIEFERKERPSTIEGREQEAQARITEYREDGSGNDDRKNRKEKYTPHDFGGTNIQGTFAQRIFAAKNANNTAAKNFVEKHIEYTPHKERPHSLQGRITEAEEWFAQKGVGFDASGSTKYSYYDFGGIATKGTLASRLGDAKTKNKRAKEFTEKYIIIRGQKNS